MILLLVSALALIGGALFIGSHRVPPPPEPGRLLYELGGDIFLADPDGGNPVHVASGGLASEAIWAPDGRHFLFHDDGAHISDSVGREVASFGNHPGFNGYPTWSFDSTRLQAWTHGFTRVSLYGVDGLLQSELKLPDGYARFRESLGQWAPDGRSIWVLITQGGAPDGGPAEAWNLPIDGSAPRRVAEHLALIGLDLSFTPDGARMAFSGRSADPNDWVLYVANSDGTDIRPVVRADDDADRGVGMVPGWSPSGEELAYFSRVPGNDNKINLKVVDVATGTTRTLLANFSYADWPPYRWSPDGSKLLVSTASGPEAGGLWSVGTDGSPATLLVEGARTGEWQPAPFGRE